MDDRYETITLAHRFNTKIAGTSFRQSEIKKLYQGQELVLSRESENPHDSNAIAVFSGDGQVGYLNKDLAKHLAPAIDNGLVDYKCAVLDITGGTSEKPTLGVNIELTNKYDYDLVTCPLNNRTVRFNPATHHYYDGKGNRMLSGSAFQAMYEYPFPSLGDKYELKGKQARDFGTAIHEAIELKGKYDMDASSTVVRLIVDDLFEKLGETRRGYEVFVAHGNLCGFIDCLQINSDGTLTILDWKCVDSLIAKERACKPPFEDLTSKGGHYSLQQNFYRVILERMGYKVKSMYLVALHDGHWLQREVKRLDVESELRKLGM